MSQVSKIHTWKISIRMTLSGAVRLTLWRGAMSEATFLITSSRLSVLCARKVGRMAY